MSESQHPAQAGEPPARRVRFVEKLDPGTTALAEFHDPYPRWAVASTAPAHALPGSLAKAGDQFLVLPVPPAAPAEATARAEEWLHAGSPGGEPAVVVPLEEGWLRWRPGRAAVSCPPEQFEAHLGWLARFAFYESELRKLEEELAADWELAEADLPLAQEVKEADLERQAQLGEALGRTLRRRMRHVRLEPHLLQFLAGVPAAQRPAAKALARRTRIVSRLESVDGQLETYEYIYDLATQRMSDFANFRREYVVEWLIAVVLSVEVVLMIAELILSYYQG